jgi:hypothetical protein
MRSGPSSPRSRNDGGPAESGCGDCWDHVALDPEHRLALSVVVGKRTEANARQLVYEFRERTDGRPVNLMTSDEYPAYAAAIAQLYGHAEPDGPLPYWLAVQRGPLARYNTESWRWLAPDCCG